MQTGRGIRTPDLVVSRSRPIYAFSFCLLQILFRLFATSHGYEKKCLMCRCYMHKCNCHKPYLQYEGRGTGLCAVSANRFGKSALFWDCWWRLLNRVLCGCSVLARWGGGASVLPAAISYFWCRHDCLARTAAYIYHHSVDLLLMSRRSDRCVSCRIPLGGGWCAGHLDTRLWVVLASPASLAAPCVGTRCPVAAVKLQRLLAGGGACGVL